ncbi:MerR family transcriptional regulator [Paenibacillus piri]|uniref:MerR family transcriptional regulator n=1 Tax=Paenibacillus piri TaxID=2547395 RepID=A0A4R5KZN1_9BACL|nr:MerR family transcriptional regulator [Paenibacillus piri]TDG00769.1 MerR family transcriptional regulator [Paenibacillus piri]
MELYKIDDVSRQTGLTKRTIRYYEEIGLLPTPQRSEGGIRLYSKDDIDLLLKMMEAREVLGFSLQELQQFVSIARLLNMQREEYRQIKGSITPAEQRDKLIDIDKTLTDQIGMLEQKIQKIQSFEAELKDLHQRVQERISTLRDEIGN